MNEQNESNNQDTENIKTAKQKFGMKKLKNPLEGFQSRFDQADKGNSETEDRLFEIILFRNNRATERMKNAWRIYGNLLSWQIIGVPEGEVG